MYTPYNLTTPVYFNPTWVTESAIKRLSLVHQSVYYESKGRDLDFYFNCIIEIPWQQL